MKKFLYLIIPAFFSLISFLIIGKHEMWRDEIQAWLLVRDSADIFSLSQNLKYEGHPGLWHYLLFPLTRIFNDPFYMQVLNLIISTCSIFILFRWSPFNNTQKILLTFSYFLVYEYTAIARSYSLSVLLLFLFCTLFENRKKNIIKISIILFLLSHTSIFGIFISLCLYLTIISEKIIEVLFQKQSLKIFFRKSFLFSLIIFFMGLFTSILQILPPKDGTFANSKIYFPNANKIFSVSKSSIQSYFPLPNLKINFWGSSFAEKSTFLEIIFIVAFILIVFIFINYFFRRPSSLFFYISSSTLLLTFFLFKFGGNLRHYGFLFLILLTSLWIFNYCYELKSNMKQRFLTKNLKVISTLLFSLQALAGIISVIFDFIFPFSAAKEVANFLNNEDLINTEIISYPDYTGTAILGYTDKINSFYHLETGKKASFIKWNNERTSRVDDLTLQKLSNKITLEGKKVILVLNKPINKYYFSENNFQKIYTSKKSIVNDEEFHIYFYLGSNNLK